MYFYSEIPLKCLRSNYKLQNIPLFLFLVKQTEGHNEVHISNMMTIQFIIHFERQTVKFHKMPNPCPDQNQYTMGFNFAVF